jgi:SAM-dependent methyltransferase
MDHRTDQKIDLVTEIAQKEGYFWGDEVSEAYFDQAEKHLETHWATVIGPLIDGIQYDLAVDLASGHGRNARRLVEKARLVYCVDINPENIRFLRRRFLGDQRFIVYQNDGAHLPFCVDSSIDLFFCFDALVHFDLEIVQSYVKEAYRVLRKGGHAFIHCSNYTGNPGGDFRDNPGWRNFMSFDIFTHLAKKARFTVVRGNKLAWAGITDLDAVFLLRKETG